MTLTNIEYGSLASSETLNDNFSYLDDRITDTAETIMTSISSILSNIATINSRLTEISEDIDDSISTLNDKIEDYKTKTKLLVSKSSAIPNWTGLSSISLSSSYTVSANGFIVLVANSDASGNITINSVAVELKAVSSSYDYASQLAIIPVKKEDVVSCSVSLRKCYFLPAAELSVSGF